MNKHANTRETLLLKLKNQYDEPAWAEFYSIYKGFIFGILIKMNIPGEVQEDLVQDILLKAWKNLPKFDYQRSNGKFRNWLGLVVTNTARSYYRNQNTVNKAMDRLAPASDSDPEIDKVTEEEWKRFISNKAWENVSETLSENVKKCFELISEGMDLQEVGEKCELPYNTVCVYKKRLINKISREIIRLENELG